MPRYNRSSSHYYRRGSSYSSGHERARQHIREAEELSQELRGTDEDVKQYFFNLPPLELDVVLVEYGKKYGSKAENYARDALPFWRDGSRRMSGMNASRLFNLLPPRMPIEHKYKLVESLWRQHSPKSYLYVSVGPNAELRDFIGPIRDHLEKQVVNYTIPTPLEARFSWLAQGDVGVKQVLLNHFLQQERELITQGLETKMPILLNHLKECHENTRRLVEQIKIGSHQVEVCFSSEHSGVSLSASKPILKPISGHTAPGSGCLFQVLAFAAILMFMVFLSL